MKKRLLSLLLVLVLVSALMPVPAQADEGPVIRCDSVTAGQGEWVSIEIRTENLEALASLELWFYYDPQAMQLQSTGTGWLLDGAFTSIHDTTPGIVSLTAASVGGISGEGTLLYLYFTVKEDCAPGRYPLSLAVGEAYDTALSPVAITARSGSIQVAESAPVYSEFHLDMELSTDTLSPGDVFTARVRNSWGYGFAGMDLKFWYDPTMFELVRAEVSEELRNELHSLHTGTEGLVRLSCASTRQLWCYELLTLELRVREGVTGTTQLTAEAADIYDENRIPYQPGSAQAQVTVIPAQEILIPTLFLESEPLVMGTEAVSTLILDAGSGLAAADFLLEYDPAVVECTAVEAAAADAYLIINPNYRDGTIRFSYVRESGTTDQTPLVTIRWRPKANASSHFTLKTTLIDPVNPDHARVTIDCPLQTACVYRTETAQATCTQPGGTALVCTACGSRTPLDSTPALGHDYGDPTFRWSDDHESCTASRICARDAGHVWQVDCTVTHVSTGESCTAPGSITYTATADFYGACYTDQVTVYLDSLGHDYAWTVLTEPGCTTEGLRRGACLRCGADAEEVIPPLGHDYEAVVTEPTCTEGGFTTHTCTRCGDCFRDGHRDPLGHDWSGTVCRRCGGTRENPFEDVPAGSFYFDPVLWAVKNGITNGTSPTAFDPNGSCMRAHVVTFLWRAAGQPEPVTTVNPFVDVKPTDFYYKAVLWAVENGVTNGLDATHFGPTAYCNRAQVVTFLHRAMGKPSYTTAVSPFTDVTDPSAFYYAPVLWAVENGITNGMGAGLFGIGSICNRAQVVTFLYRAFA